ncbi:MAG: hypothetical protein HOD60_14535 [Candidatus Nitrosopelagicus sp.]|jgi:hypothetical protein|nr:hypothetical protein [Candidatus Nitrosopelagicus sp.]
MTRTKKIGKFKVHLLENYLVLGFSKEWMKYFKDRPIFDVEINNKGRLILKGPKITTDLISGTDVKTIKEFSPTGDTM